MVRPPQSHCVAPQRDKTTAANLVVGGGGWKGNNGLTANGDECLFFRQNP